MFLGGGKAGERRDSGASRAITKAMAKKICSTQSRVAALSHLPLSWQLLGWGVAAWASSASAPEDGTGSSWQLRA